jgi:DNA-binding response OmpR family regulator
MKPRILIVEDEPLLAVDLAKQLTLGGFEIIGPAKNVSKALALVSQLGCDAAVLDLNLNHENSTRVAHELLNLNIPFVLLSGDLSVLKNLGLQGLPKLTKPVDPGTVITVLRQIIEKRATDNYLPPKKLL